MKCFDFFCACLLVVTLLIGIDAFSQITIKGNVYDITKKRPLEGVSVMSTSGGGTSTNVLGQYTIRVSIDDSIYFSYLEKPTPKFAVKTMLATNNFDISLHVTSNVLPEVFVRPPDYKEDSVQNRLDYAKVFNFRKPGVSVSSLPQGSHGPGVGFDAQELIGIFSFKKNKNMAAFQDRLYREEEDKFIDRRFNKGLVKRITALDGEELTSFMKIHRPEYNFTVDATDYEFYEYIKQNSIRFKALFLSSENK